jgi:hypothetical protein
METSPDPLNEVKQVIATLDADATQVVTHVEDEPKSASFLAFVKLHTSQIIGGLVFIGTLGIAVYLMRV